MSNVIIIRPISESWSGELYKRSLSIPHGPLTLAAHLIDKGFEPEIIDEIALTEIIQDEISNDCKNKLIKILKEEKPLCVGISSMTGEQIRRGKIFANLIKEIDGTIPIVWGGAHPSLLPEMTIEDKSVDLIITGEGDISFPILCKELKLNGSGDLTKVPGLVFKDKKQNNK